jgi:hypothetical protein
MSVLSAKALGAHQIEPVQTVGLANDAELFRYALRNWLSVG